MFCRGLVCMGANTPAPIGKDFDISMPQASRTNRELQQQQTTTTSN